MHPVLNRNTFLVKEHVGMFKAASNYDVFDPETGDMIMTCRELRIGIFTKMLRFTDYKRMTPFFLDIDAADGTQLISVKRGISLFLSKVDVLDENDQRIGGFSQKLFSIGGKFDVMGPSNQLLCTLKGKWTSWDFRFVTGDKELARVTKKWSGLGKELFTSADNYVLEISDQVPPNNPLRQLILASVFCIDLVLKE
ncbi:MAG: oxidoreductase [Planctomycetales bacterium]|nr:oxidoreductase [Planctomycetales bacterium]